jgi:hypothetical protein
MSTVGSAFSYFYKDHYSLETLTALLMEAASTLWNTDKLLQDYMVQKPSITTTMFIQLWFECHVKFPLLVFIITAFATILYPVAKWTSYPTDAPIQNVDPTIKQLGRE